MVEITANVELWNRTAGFCGILNGKMEDDISPKGTRTPTDSFISFVTSWQVNNGSEGTGYYNEEPNTKHGCESSPERATEATEVCRKLLKGKKFANCLGVVDIEPIFEACRWDYCSCSQKNGAQCACQTVDMYVRECKNKGIKLPSDWRDEQTCRKYKSCVVSVTYYRNV